MKDGEGCKYYKKCGSCQLRNMTYEEQLSFKMSRAIKLLGKYCHVDEIVPMASTAAYRNKAQAVYFDQNGKTFYGLYQSSTGKAVRCEGCPIETSAAWELFSGIKYLMNELKLRSFDPKTGRGFLRHVLIRQGFATGEIMVVIVGASNVFPKEKLFVSLLSERFPQITTIVYNVNDTDTPLWLTERERTLYGRGFITDILCGCVFRISSRSFYQINPVQTGKMYTRAIELAGLTGRETVLDAYCGIGTIGIIASKSAGKVVSVETNPAAVEDGIWNVKCSGIRNVRFFNMDTVKYIRTAVVNGEKFDVVFVDPPRSGCSRAFLSKLSVLAPKKIVYISCNPETLARDLSVLCEKYKVKRIVPFDMFPHTNHVETVVLLSRKNIDDHLEFTWTDKEFGTRGCKATYPNIKEYILDKYGFKVSSLNIAQIKSKCGIIERENYNLPKSENSRQAGCTPEKEKAIMDAFRHFKLIQEESV